MTCIETDDLAVFPVSETMRRIEELAQLLARECPLRELMGSVQRSEAND